MNRNLACGTSKSILKEAGLPGYTVANRAKTIRALRTIWDCKAESAGDSERGSLENGFENKRQSAVLQLTCKAWLITGLDPKTADPGSSLQTALFSDLCTGRSVSFSVG